MQSILHVWPSIFWVSSLVISTSIQSLAACQPLQKDGRKGGVKTKEWRPSYENQNLLVVWFNIFVYLTTMIKLAGLEGCLLWAVHVAWVLCEGEAQLCHKPKDLTQQMVHPHWKTLNRVAAWCIQCVRALYLPCFADTSCSFLFLDALNCWVINLGWLMKNIDHIYWKHNFKVTNYLKWNYCLQSPVITQNQQHVNMMNDEQNSPKHKNRPHWS